MSKAGTGFRAWVTAFAVVFTLLSPASAMAGSGAPPPGVHVDPGSPATKEYAIPLGTARDNGKATTGGPEPLFGSGITKAATSPSTAPASSASTPSAGTSDAPTHAAPTTHVRRPREPRPGRRRPADRRTHHRALISGTSARTPTPPSSQSVIGTHGSSGTGITWMLAAAAVVLLLGGIGGALLSRKARGTGPDPYPR